MSNQKKNNTSIFQKRVRYGEKTINLLLLMAAVFGIAIIFSILFFLVREAYPIPTDIWSFLSGEKWMPFKEDAPLYGTLPLIVGTLLVTLGAMVFAVPLSIGAAIFISEIATPRLRSIIKPAIELLAGIPSVVFGFFGLIVIVDFIRETFGVPTGESWLAGSIILGIMAIPTITTVAEDAINAVPMHYREGSLAMGATRWQTIRKVIIPSALSGITAAIILGVGRAVGETMAVMMVCGNSPIIPEPFLDVFSPIRTLTSTLAIETLEVPIGGDWYHALFGIAILLLIIALVINLSAVYILGKIKDKQMATGKNRNILRLKPETILKIKNYLKYVLYGFVFLIFYYMVGLLFTGLIFVSIFIYSHFKKVIVEYLNILLEGGESKLFVSLIQIEIRFFDSLDFKKLMKWAFIFLILYSLFDISTAIIAITAFIIFFALSNILSEKIKEKAAFLVLSLAIISILIILAIVIYYIVSNGIGALSWEFLTEESRDLGRAGGVSTQILGTFYLVAGAIGIALPIGVGAGVYLTEYKKEGKFTKIIRSAADLLNGTPSIVFGLFAFAVFFSYLRLGYSLVAGQVALAFMIIPTILRTTEEALRSVPQSIREGSLALGATKWATIRRVVLPPASPGILTGAVLGIGRAAGETAPIMLSAVTFSALMPAGVGEPVNALPYHIYVLATNIPGQKAISMAGGAALVLFLIVVVFYSIAIILRNYYNKKIRW